MTEEDYVHIACVEWLRLQYPKLLFWHTPNGGQRNKKQNKKGEWYCPEGQKLKKMGALEGVPDIFIPLESDIPECDHKSMTEGCLYCTKFNDLSQSSGKYHGFFCELKSRAGTVRKEQKEIMKKLMELGYYCCVARSLNEFMIEFKKYLGGA